MTNTNTRARRWWIWIIVLAVLVRLPALSWDAFADDHGLMLVIDRPLEHPSMRPWNLFNFGSTESANTAVEEARGLPWWTSPTWKVRFFRPIPSLTHTLDRTLFGANYALHHAASLAWFVLLLGLLHALYRAAGLSERIATWALAVFAFEDGSLLPVAWLANRNTLIETTFCVAAALVVLRSHGPMSRARVMAALALALGACLSKESGVAAPLLVAALLWMRSERGTFGRIGAGLAVALALGFVVFLLASGYGTRSEFYLTPWNSPLEFMQRTALLAILGALSIFGPFPVDVPIFREQWLGPWIVVAVVLGGALIVASLRAARGMPNAKFFLLWSVLTILPQGGAHPSDRLLFLPMVGAAPFIASWIARAFERIPWRSRVLPMSVAAFVLPLSALTLFASGVQFRGLIDKVNSATTSFEVPRDGSACGALVLQAPSMMTMLSPEPVWMVRTGLTKVRIHPLQAGRRALRLTRVDEHTLDIESLDEPFLSLPMERVFRADATPLTTGDVFPHQGFTVEVLAVDADGPRRLRVRCDEPWEAPTWRVLTWRDGAFRVQPLPELGRSIELARIEPLDPLLP